MLIKFTTENWMSFKERVTLSMIASRQTTFGDTLARPKGMRILPIAAIYGGNASGKSNLYAAIRFARKLIVEGTKSKETIEVQPFALCQENREAPSYFSFELLTVSDTMYEYSFSVDNEKVHYEKLVLISSTSETVLFERIMDKYPIIQENDNLLVISQNTRSNQLFLKNTIEQNQTVFEEVYEWFDEGLNIIGPQSILKIENYLDKQDDGLQSLSNILSHFDTGISRVEEEMIENSEVPNSGALRHLVQLYANTRYIKHSEDDDEQYKKLVTYHKCENGEEQKFELKQESDGTVRLMDLAPAFVDWEDNESGVMVIDELDRSLHHILIRRLIEYFVNNCAKDTRRQIIFTTHDLLLMDQNLMRRDEMYLMERSQYGSSTITSISDYKGIRIDKDVRKNYLLGRFGGIPKL